MRYEGCGPLTANFTSYGGLWKGGGIPPIFNRGKGSGSGGRMNPPFGRSDRGAGWATLGAMEPTGHGIRSYRPGTVAGVVLVAFLASTMAACGAPGNASVRKATPAGQTGHAARAEGICKEALLVDTHIDYLEVRKDGEDLSSCSSGNFDLPRAARGGLKVAFMPIYVAAEDDEAGRAVATAEARYAALQAEVARHPDRFVIARSPSEAKAAAVAGKLALVPALENCASLGGELSRIGAWRDRGAAYLGLVHLKDNAFCDSASDAGRRWGGLSPLGRDLVVEANRLGVMVDVSHASDEAVAQILDISKAPLIASHSGCRSFTPGFARNLPDELIVRIAEGGGVIQIPFGSLFLSPAYERTMSDADLAVARDVALQIAHVAEIAGIEHVGIGSDFDGVGYSLPRELRDVSAYPVLVRELLAMGFPEAEIRLILGGNLMRVWEEVLARGSTIRGE